MRSRDEHLEWCKKQARYYLDRGDAVNAIASMASDLRQHPDFIGIVDKLMPLGLRYAVDNDLDGARRFVEGFR